MSVDESLFNSSCMDTSLALISTYSPAAVIKDCFKAAMSSGAKCALS